MIEWNSLLENVLAGLICAIIGTIVRAVYLSAKAANAENKNLPTQKASKKTVRKQFFIALFTLVVSSLLIPAVPTSGLFGLLRSFLYIAFVISFLATWGAFDAAFDCYPSDDFVGEKPTENATTNAGEK